MLGDEGRGPGPRPFAYGIKRGVASSSASSAAAGVTSRAAGGLAKVRCSSGRDSSSRSGSRCPRTASMTQAQFSSGESAARASRSGCAGAPVRTALTSARAQPARSASGCERSRRTAPRRSRARVDLQQELEQRVAHGRLLGLDDLPAELLLRAVTGGDEVAQLAQALDEVHAAREVAQERRPRRRPAEVGEEAPSPRLLDEVARHVARVEGRRLARRALQQREVAGRRVERRELVLRAEARAPVRVGEQVDPVRERQVRAQRRGLRAGLAVLARREHDEPLRAGREQEPARGDDGRRAERPGQRRVEELLAMDEVHEQDAFQDGERERAPRERAGSERALREAHDVARRQAGGDVEAAAAWRVPPEHERR